MSKSAGRLTQIACYRGFFKNKKGPGTSFQAKFFVEIFDKKISLVILDELAKFNHQTVFTCQVIQ